MINYLKPTEFLIPKTVNDGYWSVIACDQFTSEKEYWETLKNFVGTNKSALKIILPEAYLNGNIDESIQAINKTMYSYLEDGTFNTTEKGFILTERITSYGRRHLGILGSIDLEDYDYSKGSKTPVRPTERTVEERLPVRVKIMEKAPIESSHTMLLYDDTVMNIAESLYNRKDSFTLLYDFELNMDGGHIRGWFIPESENINEQFAKLKTKDDSIIFAVGDGNHSVAAAKKNWNNVKATLNQDEVETHPARFFLVEVVNIHDEGICFEPIHRFYPNISSLQLDNLKKLEGSFTLYYQGEIINHKSELSVPKTIKIIDDFAETNGIKADYIHGTDNLKSLVDSTPGSVGIILDSMRKSDLFTYVEENGTLPKKTFSMGEGKEKKYYLECKKIK